MNCTCITIEGTQAPPSTTPAEVTTVILNYCNKTICHGNATCTGGACVCMSGFHGNGTNCKPVGEGRFQYFPISFKLIKKFRT